MITKPTMSAFGFSGSARRERCAFVFQCGLSAGAGAERQGGSHSAPTELLSECIKHLSAHH
jgi:hypothetical protein